MLSSPSFSLNLGGISNQPAPHLLPRQHVRQRWVCGAPSPLTALLIGSAGVIEWQMNSGFLKETDEAPEQSCSGKRIWKLQYIYLCFQSELKAIGIYLHTWRFTCSLLYPTAGSFREPAGCSCDSGTRAGTQFWHESRHPGARLRLQDDRGPRGLHHDSLNGVRFGFYAARQP